MTIVQYVALVLLALGAVASIALAATARNAGLLMPAVLFGSAAVLVLKKRKRG